MPLPNRLLLSSACLGAGLLLGGSAQAALGAGGGPALLPVDKAFSIVDARATAPKGGQGPTTLSVNFDITPGYFLYRSRLSVEDAGTPARSLPKPVLPTGAFHEDPDFGRVEIYNGGSLAARFELPAGAVPKKLRVRYQGCAEAGVCYPPQTRVVDVVRR